MGSELLEMFNKMPETARVAVMAELHKAMLWRGHDRDGGVLSKPATGHAVTHVAAIADIFGICGFDIEEYT